MQETKTTNTKPYPSISADSELNKSAIKYLSDWRKEHPENLINLEEVEQGNALFQKALKKLDYEECARIDKKELTRELKLQYIRLAVSQGYLDV